jgi:NADH-quinone oxidoreductase subunit M
MLFFIVGMLYERRHTRQISEFGGLKKVVPMLAAMLLIATLASIAVPFFNGFVGEFPILQGSWVSVTAGVWPTAIAATGMILSAVYMLWWFQRLMLGPVTSVKNRHLPDLSRNEWAVLTPLVIVVFWFGLSSGFWTHRMESTVSLLLPSNEMNDAYPIQESTSKRLAPELLKTRTGYMDFEPESKTMVEHPTITPIPYKSMKTAPNPNGAMVLPYKPTSSVLAATEVKPRPRQQASTADGSVQKPIRLEGVR